MNKITLLALTAIFAIAVLLVGCNGYAEDTADANDSETAAGVSADGSDMSSESAETAATDEGSDSGSMEVAAYTNENGELVCPVMNTVISSEESAVGYQDVDGTRYYFCCGACPDTFKADPDSYTKTE